MKAAFNTYAQSAIAASGDVGSEQRRTTVMQHRNRRWQLQEYARNAAEKLQTDDYQQPASRLTQTVHLQTAPCDPGYAGNHGQGKAAVHPMNRGQCREWQEFPIGSPA